MSAAEIVFGAAVSLVLYTYAGYALILAVVARARARRLDDTLASREWPMVTILVPAHNAGATLRKTLDTILDLDYPASQRQILVVSDASTDGTDAIAQATPGVELVRLAERRGQTATENAACRHMRGEIIVTVGDTIEVPPLALKALVAPFTSDPSVGVTSGRDVSVARDAGARRSGESGYVGYEMGIRELETTVSGIVGASGCFYAERAALYERPIPEHLSRDFAAALVARERGYRAVSVRDAVCFVPRTGSLAREYRRKVRTIARGMATLWFKRALLNPLRYPAFAWMLWSHKVARWMVPWAAIVALPALLVLATRDAWAAWLLAAVTVGALIGTLAMILRWRDAGSLPRPLAWLAFGLASNAAVIHAWLDVFRGRVAAAWDPTVRRRRAAPTRQRTA